MTTLRSTSLICSAAMQADVNALFDALGRGPGTMSVMLWSQGLDPNIDDPSHYGAHTRDDELASIVSGGAVPAGLPLEEYGLTEEAALAALSAIAIYSEAWKEGDDAMVNFMVLVNARGLKRA